MRTHYVPDFSNYSVSLKVFSAEKVVEIYIGYRFEGSGDEAHFNGNLLDINEHLSSVEELATWLMESFDNYSLQQLSKARCAKKKKYFIKEMCEKIKSVRDIDKIVAEEYYSASGRKVEAVTDRDGVLIDFARKYMNSEGIEKERAKAEMITHIYTTEAAYGDMFGQGCELNRYSWKGKDVDELAKRLCDEERAETAEGTMRHELNLRTGEYFSESLFELQ